MDERILAPSSQHLSEKSVDPRIGTTDFAPLSFPFTVDAEGCTVRFGLEQRFYRLASTQPNYNALFSLLLACFANRNRVQLEYRLPFDGIPVPEVPTYGILSAKALPASM